MQDEPTPPERPGCLQTKSAHVDRRRGSGHRRRRMWNEIDVRRVIDACRIIECRGDRNSPSGVACVLSPEMTQGPYYIDGEAVRRDVTEGKPGVPLALDLTVTDAASCTPIPDASVEIWHADAGGNYSGFNATAANTTFLRGVQIADAKGKVVFDTLYPGWYQGRATHIHLMVHVGGNVAHTGQLFFDEQINDAVYARSPYSDHTGERMTNDQDGIYANGGAQSMPQLTEAGDGYRGTITLGVQAS